MSLREQLRAQLARYDEEALIAWGNRGLLRRAGKDLETQAPRIEQEDEQALVLAFAGHRQRFDARGPTQAHCGCPASGVCQHLLAVVLWLQREGLAPEATLDCPSAPPGSVEAHADRTAAIADVADPHAPLHAELLAFGAAQLVKYAGRHGYRWAWQHVQDADPAQAPRIGGERNIVIDLVQPRIVFRYMGGGLAHLIADSAPSKIEKYRVVAVLAYQRAHGQAIAPPELPTLAPALDLGKAHQLGAGRDPARRDSRTRLRAALAQLLDECMALGLSHLSQQMQERYSTLAVWAQGADYPRLALLLRRIADHVELLLERAGGADEHRLLEELALAHALVSALALADMAGQAPAHLVGRARGEYGNTGNLVLWGLGALPWRAASGYLGLTMLFWSPQSRSFLACTDARPESQRFDPRARYQAPGPWAGLAAPAQASGQRLQLQDAQASAAGRLSASDKTHVAVQALPSTELFAGLSPHTCWQQLIDSRQSLPASLLSKPRPMLDWVVLRPARYAQARFDASRQTLVWPLHDAEDQVLEAEIAYSPLSAHAIERIEEMTPQQLDGQWLVARLRSAAGRWAVEPLSLIHRENGQGVAVDALYFDASPRSGPPDLATQKLRASRRQAAAATPATLQPTRTPTALADYRQWLAQCAERGLGQALIPRLEAEHDQHQQRLRDAGLTTFPSPDQLPAAASRLLTHYYICLQYLRLMDGDGSA